jgi:hypothetical protein
MSQRPIIDAGPSLNFLSINRERLLIATMGKLSAPESVQTEVFRKARQDLRFRPAEVTWRKLTPTYIEVLADDPTDELARVVNRITRAHLTDHGDLRSRFARSQIMIEAMVTVAS